MSALLGLILMLLLLPLVFVAATVGGYIAGTLAVIACPIFLCLAKSAADAHEWMLMWHRLGWSVVCGIAGFVIVRFGMNVIAAEPTPLGASYRRRQAEFTDYSGARRARISIAKYMRKTYGAESGW